MGILLRIVGIIDAVNKLFGKLIIWLVLAATVISAANAVARRAFNFSSNAYRRVELKAQLSGAADTAQVIDVLKKKLAEIPNVMKTPGPEVEILDFNLVGPVLAVALEAGGYQPFGSTTGRDDPAAFEEIRIR